MKTDKPYTVLLLSAGRRVELLACIRDTFARHGVPLRLVTCDMDPCAPAHFFSDVRVKVRPAREEGYAEEILAIAREHACDLILPTIDPELLPLANLRDEFLRTSLINLSPLRAIKICRDKQKTADFLRKCGLGAPLTYRCIDEVSFPAFVKPLHGSASVQAFRVEDRQAMETAVRQIDRPVMQQLILGEEYSVDIFADMDSEPVTVVPRRRIATRGGEIQKGYIIKNRLVIEESKRAIRALGLTGHNTLQCIQNGEGVFFIEINPRFGGGAPMSMRAGADSVWNLYKMSKGERPAYNEDYKDKLYCVRFDSSIFYNEQGEKVDL